MKSLALVHGSLVLAVLLFMSACQKNDGSGNQQQPAPVANPSPAPTQEQAQPQAPTNEAPKKAATEVEPETSTVNRPAEVVEISVAKNTDLLEPESGPRIFLNQLNKYTIKVSIHNAEAEAVQIYRKTANNEPQVLSLSSERISDTTQVFVDELEYTEKSLAPKTYTYIVKRGEQTLASRKFEVRADIYVSQEKDAPQLGLHPGKYQLGILYFDFKARLNTRGQDFEITAKELIANNSVIESFSESEANTPAAEGLAGKNGGMIRIKADRAQGTLFVFMRGTRGGKGHKGEEQTAIKERAENGVDEVSRSHKVCDDSFKQTRDPKDIISLRAPCQSVIECVVSATAGKNGQPGFPGKPGSPGLAGGNSGSFEITFERNDNFFVTTESLGGLGGAGGDGGNGGVGGLGGFPGKFSQCSYLSTGIGSTGPVGSFGETGSSGPAGVNEVSCVNDLISKNNSCR